MRADIERQKPARARAARIRLGMVNYLETLADVIAARAQNDHLTLGYKSWQEYLDTEYGAERLKLAPEMQLKAIVELRLAGASQREIGHTLGLNQSNVSRALADRSGDADASPDEIYDRDGNLVPPAKSSVVEAMTGAIEDAAERAQTAGLAGPAPDAEQASAASGTAAAGDRVGSPAAAPQDPSGAFDGFSGTEETGEGATEPDAGGRAGTLPPATDHPGSSNPGEGAGSAPAPAAGGAASTMPPAAPSSPSEPAAPGEAEVQGGPAPSPAGPLCEKCGAAIGDDGYRRCASCDPDGMHTADDGDGCRLCALLATVPDEYLPIQVGEGVHGLQLECRCGAVVSHLKAGMPLGIALVEAHLHAGSCNGGTP